MPIVDDYAAIAAELRRIHGAHALPYRGKPDP
jgi:hypothetical protein